MAKDVLKIQTSQVVKFEKAANLTGVKIVNVVKYGSISAVEVDFKKPSNLFELRENMELMDDTPMEVKNVEPKKEGK